MEKTQKANYIENMIFTKDEVARIYKNEAAGGLIITADLHGMNRTEARRFLKNLIAINRNPFTLDVIHGYVHGTALKQMISEESLSKRVIKKECKAYNLGLTKLTVA